MTRIRTASFQFHWLTAVYFISFGGAVIWSRVPSGASSQLYKIGLTPEAMGIILIIAGAGMFITNSLRWQLLLTLAHLPYTFAALLLAFSPVHLGQSLAVYTFVQLASPVLAYHDALVKRWSKS